jgi:hypothetical protein
MKSVFFSFLFTLIIMTLCYAQDKQATPSDVNHECHALHEEEVEIMVDIHVATTDCGGKDNWMGCIVSAAQFNGGLLDVVHSRQGQLGCKGSGGKSPAKWAPSGLLNSNLSLWSIHQKNQIVAKWPTAKNSALSKIGLQSNEQLKIAKLLAANDKEAYNAQFSAAQDAFDGVISIDDLQYELEAIAEAHLADEAAILGSNYDRFVQASLNGITLK